MDVLTWDEIKNTPLEKAPFMNINQISNGNKQESNEDSEDSQEDQESPPDKVLESMGNGCYPLSSNFTTIRSEENPEKIDFMPARQRFPHVSYSDSIISTCRPLREEYKSFLLRSEDEEFQQGRELDATMKTMNEFDRMDTPWFDRDYHHFRRVVEDPDWRSRVKDDSPLMKFLREHVHSENFHSPEARLSAIQALQYEEMMLRDLYKKARFNKVDNPEEGWYSISSKEFHDNLVRNTHQLTTKRKPRKIPFKQAVHDGPWKPGFKQPRNFDQMHHYKL